MAQASLLALSAVIAALAMFVWRARPDAAANRWFAAQTIFLASWILGVSGLQSASHLNAWGRFTFASASLIPAAFLGFTRCFPTETSWPPQRLLRLTFAIGIAVALLSLLTPLVVYDNTLTREGLIRRSGRLYPVFYIYFVLAWTAALGVFIHKWSSARGLARAQLQYFGVGIVIAALGGIGTNLVLPVLIGRSTYSWLGPYFSFGFVALTAHAIIRHRLMDLRLVINRGLALVIGMALLSGLAIAIVRIVFPVLGKRDLAVPLDVVAVTIVVFGMLTAPAQRLLHRLLDPYLYRGRIEYASALREATHKLSRLMQPRDLAAELNTLLTEAFVPEFFLMASRSLDGEGLEELSSVGEFSNDILSIASAIVGEQAPRVVLVSPSRQSSPHSAEFDTLRTAGVEVIITLARRDRTLGAILLGPRRSGDAYFTTDLAFMESLSELASIALENALLYRHRTHMLEYSERLLESLDSAVVAIDVSGQISSFNAAARTLLGIPESARGRHLDVLPSEVAWGLALAIRGRWLPRDVEITIDHDFRGALPLIMSTAVFHEQNGQTTGALIVATDLSTVKALERNQRRIDHLGLMARFYAGIAHEIRSPLAAISNFIAMLPDRFDDPEYRDTAARLLPMEVGRIVRLADRLRLMAPSEDGKLAAIALPPLLADIVAIHAPASEDSRVHIILDCPPNLPKILGDPAQLVQLFVNLLKNAVESMADGGTVTIAAKHSPTRHGAGRLLVQVIDEGSGLDPSIRSKLFQPFVTTKASGTGLGLSICREIADFHRARLTVSPRSRAKGTVAQIDFPCLPDETGVNTSRTPTLLEPTATKRT